MEDQERQEQDDQADEVEDLDVPEGQQEDVSGGVMRGVDEHLGLWD
jgi:hypothetical protein